MPFDDPGILKPKRREASSRHAATDEATESEQPRGNNMRERYKLRGDNESTATLKVGRVNGFTPTFIGFIEFRCHGQYLYGESCKVERLNVLDALADARRQLNDQGEWHLID
jgi:hypothetical protein